MCTKGGKKSTHESVKDNCQGFSWLQTRLPITIEATYDIQMLNRHDMWRVIEGDRIRVRCRMWAGYAEHTIGKVFRNKCRGQVEEERHGKTCVTDLDSFKIQRFLSQRSSSQRLEGGAQEEQEERTNGKGNLGQRNQSYEHEDIGA